MKKMAHSPGLNFGGPKAEKIKAAMKAIRAGKFNPFKGETKE